MPESREIYKQLCRQYYIPWYANDWWLDCSCGPDNWSALLAKGSQDNIIAAMPLPKRKFLGFEFLMQPAFTAYLHIWIKPPTSSRQVYRNNREQRIIQSLVKQLPNTRLTDLLFDESLKNMLPFYWEGYQNRLRYTYQFSDLSDTSRIHREMESSARNHIRKAKENLSINDQATVEDLYSLVHNSLERKGIAFRLKPEKLQKMADVLRKNASLKIYSAQDNSGKPLAAIAIVLDAQRASFWLSGSNIEGRKNSAIYGLLWKAVKDAAKNVNRFDFEGSMAPSVEAVFRTFGATRTPYFRIQKSRPRFLSLLRK
ncbi:MAG: GNAT family N-acetyltransferase [Bacteroidetes bacterium]|nr:GNAT family N-acetyltransferase [Bacteroidota bacterium]